MMSKFINTRLLFCCLVAVGLLAGTGAVQGQVPTLSPAIRAAARMRIKHYNDWLNAAWTDNDHPYAALRREIERKATDGKAAVAEMRTYQAQLVQQPRSVSAQFAYFYAAFLASTMPGGLSFEEGFQSLERLGGLYSDIANAPHPETYNYARVAFLCEAYSWANPSLKGVALRLVHQNPADIDAVFYTARVLAVSRSPSDKNLALTLAENLAGRYPTNPKVYDCLASVHFQNWWQTKSQSEGQKAISEYNKYLEMAPVDATYRSEAESHIAQIQHGMSS